MAFFFKVHFILIVQGLWGCSTEVNRFLDNCHDIITNNILVCFCGGVHRYKYDIGCFNYYSLIKAFPFGSMGPISIDGNWWFYRD